MTKGRPLQATTLRLILIVLLFVIAIAATGIFIFVTDRLRDTATEASHILAKANSSQNDIQILQRIESELAKNKEVAERARSIVADSQSYQYQDQIIKDLTDYAVRSGITITNFDFKTTQSSTPGTQSPPATGQPAPTGVKSTSVSITLKNPVPYDNILRFIHSIEQNLTKMQISKIGLSKETGGNVISDSLTIEVYVR